MIAISLILNLVVLGPVTVGLLRQTPGLEPAFGPDSPARRILLAVYLSIAGLSVVLLALLALAPAMAGQMALSLLALLIIYKALTVPLVGLRNPVVKTNVAVMIFHSATIALAMI